jgi:hypothetical protein
VGEIENDRQGQTILENFIIVKLCDNLALFIAHFNLQQHRLHVIRIGMQELILSDDTVEGVSNQGQVTLGKSHLTPETA